MHRIWREKAKETVRTPTLLKLFLEPTQAG